MVTGSLPATIFKQAPKHAGKNAGSKTFPQHTKQKLHAPHASSSDVDGHIRPPLCCGDYTDYDSIINWTSERLQMNPCPQTPLLAQYHTLPHKDKQPFL